MTKFFDAFISYGRVDSKEFAIKLQANLNKNGFQVWFDFNDIPPAVDFQNQIDDGIEKAHNFLFIISPHSVNSRYCRKEIELAIKFNKRIIPLLHVDEISRETWQQRNPNGTDEEWESYKAAGKHTSKQNMHPTIRKLNWLPFQESQNNFDQSLEKLIDLLNAHGDYVKQHTKFLDNALAWEKNQKQTSYLLVGEEKQKATSWLKIRFKDEQAPCLPSDLHCEYITESIKNGNNLMTQVMLSYADEDRATMEKIRTSLRREGITVWTDTTDIQTGEDFTNSIKQGIEGADNLVYLLSPNSINSSYCQQELDLAVSFNKRIIPLLVQNTEDLELPSALRDLQYIDLTDNVTAGDYQLDESQLLQILYEDAAYYNEHKTLLTKALKWEQQNKNPSILLRGYNLRSAKTWLEVAQKRTQNSPTSLQSEFINASLQQPPLDSLDVFISYSRADSDLARKLNDALQQQGKTTWFDQESIASGSNFQEEINRGIKVSDNFLFIISPRSVNSPYCKDEVGYAASLNKRFVTLLYQEVETSKLHPELGKVQWIDFNSNEKDFNANFKKLLRTLNTDRKYIRSHSKWLQRALEWEKKQRNDDSLLRGSIFSEAQKWLIAAENNQKKPTPTNLQKEYIYQSKKAKSRSLLFKLLFGCTAVFTLATISLSTYTIWEKLNDDNDWVNSLTFSSDGSMMASASDNNKVRIWKSDSTGTPNFEELRPSNSDPQEMPIFEGNTVAFSPNNNTIASGSDDNKVRLFDPEGNEIKTLEGHEDRVNSVAFSPDSKLIASASDDKTVRLWNLEGELLHTLKAHEKFVIKVTFHPDDKWIASADNDGTVIIWDTEGKLIKEYKRKKEPLFIKFLNYIKK